VRTAALDEMRDCRRDDDCPCGAHCTLGTCTFDCRAEGDCADGLACDDFGRCREAGAPRIAAATTPSAARVGVEPAVQRASSIETPYHFRVRPHAGATGRVRVVARGPVTLTCAGEAAPTGECVVADVPADGFEITLALDETAKADRAPESPGADVYDEAGGRTQVGLVVGVGAPDSVPFTGRYHGTASLGGGAGLADSGDARDLRARVTAEVFDDVVVLHDPEQLVLPVDPLVLRASVAEDATVDLPQMVWFAAEAGATDGAEIWSPATSAASPMGAGLLDLSFALALQGLSAGGGAAPTLTLRVALTREADLEEGGEAPELTPAATPRFAADRGDARFASGIAFEAAALAAIAADPAKRAIALRGESTSVVGCVADVQRLRAETLPGVCEANRPAQVLPSDCEAAALGLDAAGPAAIPCAWDIDVTFDPPECGADSGACIAACPGGEASDGCRSFCRELCRYQGDAQPRSACAVVQAVIGCEVEVRAGEWVRNPDGASGSRLTGACVLPPVPERDRAACAVVGLCAQDSDLAAEAVAGAAVSARSGDVLCATAEGDTPSDAFRALESEPNDLDALVASCLDDLARVPANTFEATAGCLGLARALTAFELAAPLTGDDAGAGAMAHRTIQAVVQVQALVPTLALDLHREKLMLAEDPRTEDTLAALDASIALWGVVLDPRVIGVLRGLPDAVLANPDPRPHLGLNVSVDAPSGPTRGIAIALLDAAAAQLELIDFLLERAWFEGENARMRDRQSRAAALLRKVQLVAAMAEELQMRAARAGAPEGQTHWEAARQRYMLGVRRTLHRLVDIEAGRNPLGIEALDVPLYYRGDPLGPNERFSAISRYLAGEGPGARALAPTAVTEAAEALEEARLQWRVRTDLELNADRRIEDIVRRYGELITGFCGAPIDDPDFDVGSFNVLDRPLDTEVCFVEPDCRPRPEGFLETLSAADVGGALCVATRLRSAYGAMMGTPPAPLATLLDAVAPAFTKAAIGTRAFPLTLSSAEVDVNVRTAHVLVNGTEYTVELDALGGFGADLPPELLAPDVPAAFDPNSTAPLQSRSAFAQIRDDCEASRQATLALRPRTAPAACEKADDCPRSYGCVLGTCTAQAASDPLDRVDCYFDGAISEQALAVRSAAIEIEIARAEYEEYVTRYDLAKRSCIILHAGNDAQEAELSAHNDTMNALDRGRTAAASIAHAAGGAKDCSASFNVETVITGAVAGVCGFAVVEAVANIAVEVLDLQMNEAERDHEAAAQAIQNNTDEARCFNDAEMELVGARAASLRIRQTAQAQASAMINLRGQKSYTAGLWGEGNIAVSNERERLARSLPSRFVLSDQANTYLRRFRRAQRLVYLSVRAAEYEFQATLAARQQALAATQPSELEEALRGVSGVVNANRVDGASPGSLHAVLSLREHLLQIRDRSENPDGEQRLSEAERFQLLLTTPQNAVYDEAGEYLGQQIPFSIQPLGAIGLGRSQGVPILADNDCAERVWSVNAAVIGEEVLEGGESSFTRLDLLQRNTFYSQWCAAPQAGEPEFQVSTVRPAVNLLSDGLDELRPPVPADATDEFTRGRMQPYLNVTRQEFEREDYAQGSTTELAGRGLYGDYALFIPRAVISLDGSPGLRLENIDDVLLRLDYVSVAR
jgi:hypothetical protein